MKEENKMTDKTEMNKVQKEFVEFVDKYYNSRKDKYDHIYWLVWSEEDEEGYEDWIEEVINDFCKEYEYKYNEVVKKLNENFEMERF